MSKESINKLLEQLGLSKNEIKVYLALLKINTGLITDIANTANLPRQTVYRAIPSLIEKKLIHTSPKGKRQEYTASEPVKIKSLVDKLRFDVDELLPDLNDLYDNKTKTAPTTKVLTGSPGITYVLNDILSTLKHGGAYYRYSSIDNIDRTNKYLPKYFRRNRDQKDLIRYVITNNSNLKRKAKKNKRFVKAINEEFQLFDYNIMQIIYGNKVGIIDYNTETSVIIESKNIANFQRKVFLSLFQNL